MSAAAQPWALVAPWWKWPNPADTAGGRLTRPQLQKYETSQLVAAFLKNPQHYLKFVDEDLVHIVQQAAAIPVGSNGKPRRFSELAYVIDPLRTRKIFLDTHKRFYLVVCQIHCDAPGFPRADRGDVCQAGFVVRRRTTDVPLAGVKAASAILQRINTARTQLAVLDAQATRVAATARRIVATSPMVTGSTAMASSATTFTSGLVNEGLSSTIAVQRASTRTLIATERDRLAAWAAQFNVAPRLQGWFNDPSLDKVGSWQDVDAQPSNLTGEAVFPMYPLIPAANDTKHAGQFGTIYFGILPTSSREHDPLGRARFDDQQYYEVSCFASRHLIPHDRGSPCGCPDQLFWSLPSDPYRLAAHFDVVGTGKRPVTVQLPDLDALAAQAAPTFGVNFAKPKNSLMIQGKKDGSPGASGRTSFPEICSFSIPLITIVASFVFELFLPVVTLIFGLWFMLKLKFCIPPELQLSASLTAEFSLDPGKASISAEASISADVTARINAEYGSQPEIASALTNDFAPLATANMEAARAAASAGAGPDASANIEFAAEVAYP